MRTIQEIAKERFVYHEQLKIKSQKPISKIHRFSIFKLKILKRLYDDQYGEINFLIQDIDSPKEKCILYAILFQPNTINYIKYWRSVEMDNEMGNLIVNAFINGYLKENYRMKLYECF